MLLILTIITSMIYLRVVTGIAQVTSPHQANSNPIVIDGKTYIWLGFDWYVSL